MAEFVGDVVALGSIAVFLWAVIGIFSPHTAKLSGRGQAVGLWAVSIVMALTARDILPTDTPTSAEPVQVEATLSSNERFISQVDYGKDWPFSVEEGVLSCDPSSRGGGRLDVVFTTGGVSYALNGTAIDSGYAEIDPIRRLGPPLGQAEPLTTMPEAERRQLFADMVNCENNANKEAERRFPTNFAGVQMTDFSAKLEEADQLTDSCKESLREGAALTEAEFDRIGWEGVVLGWPPLSPSRMNVSQIIQDGLVLCERLLAAPAVAQDSFSGRSPTCGPINGETQQDLKNVEKFCEAMIPDELAPGVEAVESAYAMGSTLWLKVTRPMADGIRRLDSLDAERLIRNWMRVWQQLSDSHSVTVTAEWQDIEIAVGQTLFGSGGDEVTIHR